MILVTILDQPIPLLPDSDDLKIASIVVYEDQLSDAKLLEEYDEAKILEFLKSCSEKIVLGSSVHKQVFRGLYPEVEIYIHGINGFDYGKDIILGDVSYSVGPSTSYIIERSYMIEDPEYVLATIKDILGL